jgi:hypothetical protein
MNESTAHGNLFTLLKFDIKCFINHSSIKRSAITRIDMTTNDVVSSLTTKGEIEDHLLLRNPKAYWVPLEDYSVIQAPPPRRVHYRWIFHSS